MIEHSLITAVRDGLAALTDMEKARSMRRYMKSEMPFRGVQKPDRRTLAKRVFAEHPLPDEATWTATVLELWRAAEYREERYLAIDLTGLRQYAEWQTPELVPMYEEMIVTGAWWDLVDVLAIHRIGPLLREHPAELTPLLRDWATDDDLWKRRTSIICQVGSRHRTDTELLRRAIESNVDDRDFFIRKGIGWALREYSKHNVDWVAEFVRTHSGLSPLSRREASKYLGQRSVAP
jgi:3-methyladenine DNA glycosylase AlkD